MSDIPPGGQTGWSAMTHKQLHEAVNDPAGDPGASMAAEEAWTRIAAMLDASHARIRAAVGRSAETWVGMAATAARAAFDPLHAWTALTVDDAATVAAQLTDQSFHAAELRRKLPPPVNEDEVRGALMMQAGPVGALMVSDEEVAEVTSRISTEGPDFQHAVALMHAYQDDSDNRAGVLDIRTQPPQVVVSGPDSAPTRVAEVPSPPAGAGPAPGGAPSVPGPTPAPGAGPGPVAVPPPIGSMPGPGGGREAPRTSAPPPVGTGTPAPPAPGARVGPQVRPDAPPGRTAPAPGPAVPGGATPGGFSAPLPGRPAEPTPRPAPSGRLDPHKLPPGFGGRSPGVDPVPLGRSPAGPAPGGPAPKDWRELVRAEGPRGAAAEPAHGGARPAGEQRPAGSMYPPMAGGGTGGGGNTRRRPGYLLGDGGYFRDDRWFPPAVMTQDDLLPGQDDQPAR